MAISPPSSEVEAILRVEHLTRRFSQTPAIEDISFTLKRGEILGVIGRSGAGKSTLLRCLNGLERADSGRVIVNGQDLTQCKEAQWRVLRRQVGMIFQHFNLLSSQTVLENVALPLKLSGISHAVRTARAQALLERVGLADKAQSYPKSLSGGQKQRVGIARALASDPVMLLCDEATSALDPETTQSVLELLRGINRDLNLTIVLITHEMNVVRQISDKVLVLHHGRIVEQGQTANIMVAPKAEQTRLMLKAAGFLYESGEVNVRLAV